MLLDAPRSGFSSAGFPAKGPSALLGGIWVNCLVPNTNLVCPAWAPVLLHVKSRRGQRVTCLQGRVSFPYPNALSADCRGEQCDVPDGLEPRHPRTHPRWHVPLVLVLWVPIICTPDLY